MVNFLFTQNIYRRASEAIVVTCSHFYFSLFCVWNNRS